MNRKISSKALSKEFKKILEDTQQNLDFIKDKSTDDLNIGQTFYLFGMLQGFTTDLQEKIDDFKTQVGL